MPRALVKAFVRLQPQSVPTPFLGDDIARPKVLSFLQVSQSDHRDMATSGAPSTVPTPVDSRTTTASPKVVYLTVGPAKWCGMKPPKVVTHLAREWHITRYDKSVMKGTVQLHTRDGRLLVTDNMDITAYKTAKGEPLTCRFANGKAFLNEDLPADVKVYNSEDFSSRPWLRSGRPPHRT